MTFETPSDRARARILLAMKARDLSQTDVAGILSWTQPRVSKVLNGRVELGVEELAALCFAVGISMTEAVRDHGMEFCAEMTPTELRLFERIRSTTPAKRDAIMTLLEVTPAPPRRALPPTPRKPRKE